MKDRPYNFSAGPAILPTDVLKRAQESIWDLAGSGIGVLEHSHRGGEINDIFTNTKALVRELAGVPDNYSVLFLQGGASSQFYMVPMNLLGDGKTADYVNTGTWSKKAMKEAALFGTVNEAASSADKDFTYIPGQGDLSWSSAPVYVHYTSNNTIAGTQWRTPPVPPDGVPLVCDASSDIFSKPIDVSPFGIIYAGAQKNLGPAGVTLVIARNDLIQAGPKDIPTMLQYRTHADKDSRFNTPPVFPIYVLGEVLSWLKNLGGLKAIEEQNEAKAKLIYDYLDESSFFDGTADTASRSRMNITFRSPNGDLDKKFISEATERGLKGLKGHRSVGGMRASVYNAFPTDGCDALVGFMRIFERENK